MKYLILAFMTFFSYSSLWATPLDYQLSLSIEASTTLESLGKDLKSAGSEINFNCRPLCQLKISPDPSAQMEVDLIEKPFSGEPFILRLYGGTQMTQKALYNAIGNFTTTEDFKGRLDERELILDNSNIRFRCVSSRDEKPQYQCWVLILNKILDHP